MDRQSLIGAMIATASAPLKSVTVPQWGTIYVKAPTVAEVDATSGFKEPEDGKVRRFARAAARIMCDEHGNRIFDATSEEDIQLLASQPWELLQKVLAAAEAGGGKDDSGN